MRRRSASSSRVSIALVVATLVASGCGAAPQSDVEAPEPDGAQPEAGASSTAGPTSMHESTARPTADPESTAGGDDRVQPEVLAALHAEGQVSVLVSLAASDDPEEIARAADRVLGDVDESAFQVRTRFEAVPAIAGTVTDESALDVWRSHPDVVAVSLDPGGTGSGGG